MYEMRNECMRGKKNNNPKKLHFLQKKEGKLVARKNAHHDNNLKRKVKEDRKHQ